MNWIYNKLKNDIGDKRYQHSLNVMEECIKLANHYAYPKEKAAIAGLLHDCGKLVDRKNILKLAKDFGIILDDVIKNNHQLIHGPLGMELARNQYKIEDDDILSAIRFHTTGREHMSLIEKIVYIADLIEPNRNFPGLQKIRDAAYKDIDESILCSMNNTIKFLIDRDKPIHMDTIKGRNQLLISKKME